MAEPDLVYNVTKAIDLQAPVYSIAQAGTSGWAANSQVYDWVIPYNEGAVRYYEEVGTWSAELQAHNDELVARGEVLQEAWAQMADVTATGDEFAAEWMEARATALEAAGMPVYFR
jgi:hypothetical protein